MPVVIHEFEITPPAMPAPVAAPSSTNAPAPTTAQATRPADAQRVLAEARERALRVFAH